MHPFRWCKKNYCHEAFSLHTVLLKYKGKTAGSSITPRSAFCLSPRGFLYLI